MDYSITPIVDATIGVTIKAFEASVYLNFTDPYERDWKAIPTIGLKATEELSACNAIFANLFVKYAEYLMDPVTLIAAYGFRLGTTINYTNEGQT